MIDYLIEQIREVNDNQRARLMVREYLQARILEALQEAGVFTVVSIRPAVAGAEYSVFTQCPKADMLARCVA